MRPSKNEYMMHLAVVASTRGTCNRRRVGCVLATADGRVISTGYNGSAPGAPHCDDVGHMLHNERCVRTIHAEANAIAQAARMGSSLAGSVAYCTTRPCPTCSLLLASAGVTSVVHLEPYHSSEDELSAMIGVPVVFERYSGGEPWLIPIVR